MEEMDKMEDLRAKGVNMNFDYEKEKKEFIDELEAGEYNIEISPNEEVDYDQSVNDDVSAFSEHLNSEEAKKLAAETFGK